MKKLIAILLTAVLVFTFVSCSTESFVDETEDEDIVLYNDVEEDDFNQDVTEKIEFLEIVAVDNEECFIKITDIDEGNFWGYTLKVYLENRSSENDYAFSLDNVFVNGVETTSLFYEEVSAGKAANASLTISDDDIEDIVGDFTNIELVFRVYDANDWTAEPVVIETANVYPYGIDKSVLFERAPADTDTVIMDNEYGRVVVIGYEYDSIWGYTAKIYIENDSQLNLFYNVEDASVNGLMMDPFYGTTVAAGKRKFGEISWSDSQFEENGIEQVDEIQFTLSVSDGDDWFADNVFEEIIVLNP